MMVNINRVLWYSFLAYWIGSLSLGLFLPFVAVFVLQQIVGGDVNVIGFAAGILWAIKACSQIPGGAFLDRICKGNHRRKFYFFSINMFAESFLIFSFLIITLPWQLYLVQALRGLMTGFTVPSIMVIFSGYLDKGEAGKEWGTLGAITGVLYGIGGIIAALIISKFGFQSLFIIAGSVHLLGALISLLIPKVAKDFLS